MDEQSCALESQFKGEANTQSLPMVSVHQDCIRSNGNLCLAHLRRGAACNTFASFAKTVEKNPKGMPRTESVLELRSLSDFRLNLPKAAAVVSFWILGPRIGRGDPPFSSQDSTVASCRAVLVCAS